jgi:hypothetical protein
MEDDLARKMPPFRIGHCAIRQLVKKNKSRTAGAKQPVFAIEPAN